MRILRPFVVVLAVLPSLLVPGVAASAPGPTDLVLVGPTSITLSEKATSAALDLCNNSDRAVPATVTVREVGPAAFGAAVTDLPPFQVEAGSCAPVTVTLVAAPSEDQVGTLGFTAPGVGIVSLPVTITSAATSTPTFVRALGPTSFHATGGQHFWGEASLDESGLALQFSDKAFAVDDAPDGPWEFSDGETVISVSGQLEGDGAVKTLVLAMPDGSVPAGTYKGVLSFTDDDEGDVPVTIDVDDSHGLLFLLLTLGVLLGLLSKLATDRLRVTARLKRRRKGLSRLYDAALTSPWSERFPRPMDKAVTTWCQANEKAQDGYLRWTTLIDQDDPVFQKVVTELANAEKDAETFRDHLVPALEDLVKAHDTLQKWLAPRLPGWQPAIVSGSDGVTMTLRGRDDAAPGGAAPTYEALQVGAATKIRDRAVSLTALLPVWQDLAERLVRLAQWEMDLHREATQAGTAEAAKTVDEALDRAQTNLQLVLTNLMEAADLDAIKLVEKGADLQPAAEALKAAEGALGADVPPVAPSRETSALDGIYPPHHSHNLVRDEDAGPVEPGVYDTFVEPPSYVTVARSFLNAVAQVAADVLPLFVAPLVALLVAYVAAEKAILDTATFATSTTVLATIMAGLAATAVVDAVFAGLTWSRSGLTSLVKVK